MQLNAVAVHDLTLAVLPGMIERKAGGILIPGTPEDFGKVIADETAKWAKVVQATGATAE